MLFKDRECVVCVSYLEVGKIKLEYENVRCQMSLKSQ